MAIHLVIYVGAERGEGFWRGDVVAVVDAATTSLGRKVDGNPKFEIVEPPADVTRQEVQHFMESDQVDTPDPEHPEGFRRSIRGKRRVGLDVDQLPGASGARRIRRVARGDLAKVKDHAAARANLGIIA